MATKPGTIAFILEQAGDAGQVSAKKMFGEYGLYCDGKLVALVCDDQLFVKPTEAGRAYLGSVTEAPPYPSAKPCFLVSGEAWEDRDWLSGLIEVTAAASPAPAPRKRPAATKRGVP